METQGKKGQSKETPEESLNVNWNEIKGRIKSEYSNVTDEDFQFMKGKESDVINRLQQKTGKTKAEVRNWVRSLTKVV